MLRSEEVAHYLERHPEFFEQYSEMLSTITIPHPHGGRAIPLVERQILSLRKKNRALESKLKDLVAFAEENDQISERVHRLAIALLLAPSLEAVLHAFYFNLREDFAVPHVGLRIWGIDDPPDLPEFDVAPDDRAEMELSQPVCGAHPCPGYRPSAADDLTHLRSFANIPLSGDTIRGLLVLASEDAQRFYAGMGTLYLKRLADLVSAAVSRFVANG
jgi:uncharacterized protein YigA (DUF484 family)